MIARGNHAYAYIYFYVYCGYNDADYNDVIFLISHNISLLTSLYKIISSIIEAISFLGHFYSRNIDYYRDIMAL